MMSLTCDKGLRCRKWDCALVHEETDWERDWEQDLEDWKVEHGETDYTYSYMEEEATVNQDQ